MGKSLCHTSKNPGRTKTMNFFAVGGQDEQGNPGRITVVDMPGYGHKSRAEWGEEIMKYLVGRRQLVRTFVLIDSMQGLKQSDEALLQSLRENAISHQVILSKVDRILSPKSQGYIKVPQSYVAVLQSKFESIRNQVDAMDVAGPKAVGEILACSCKTSHKEGKWLGVNNLRWSILAAAGFTEARRRSEMLNTDIGDEKASQPASLSLSSP
ncbi:MAG: hypothetical protein Q9201_003825 [Fulgogasparrea decipioides]